MKLYRETNIPPEAYMLRMNVEQGFVTLFNTSLLSHLDANLTECSYEQYQRFKEIIDLEFPAPDHKYPLVKI